MDTEEYVQCQFMIVGFGHPHVIDYDTLHIHIFLTQSF